MLVRLLDETAVDRRREPSGASIAQSAGVQRRAQDAANRPEAEVCRGGDCRVCRTLSSELPDRRRRGHRCRIRLDQLAVADPPEAYLDEPTALVGVVADLGRIATTYRPREASAVRLGLDRLAGPVLPRVLVGRQHPLVSEQKRGTRLVKLVAGIDGGPQVAREATDVADHEHVVVAPGPREHVGELVRRPDRPARVSDLPFDAGIDHAVCADRPDALLALGSRAIALGLAPG
ncbi:MAG TPA: hypothetical protein VIK16_01750 [Candidatus Limnocylindrales bacterium]